MPATYLLLAGSMVAVWLPPLRAKGFSVPAWLPLFAAAVVAGLLGHVLTWPALMSLALLASATSLARRSSRRWLRAASMVAAAVIAVGLAVHVFPGYQNQALVTGLRLSAGTPPITTFMNFDKASAGLFLLVAFAPRIDTVARLKLVLPAAAGISAATVVVVLGLATALGYMAPDLKFPDVAPAWLAVNLLFTCVAEEAVFRGLLQERLAAALPARRLWQGLGIAVSAVLFGLAHAAGGQVLVLLAMLAGAGYSLAYAATRRIESAILAHFAVNAVHFLGFSYPHL